MTLNAAQIDHIRKLHAAKVPPAEIIKRTMLPAEAVYLLILTDAIDAINAEYAVEDKPKRTYIKKGSKQK